jgi:AAA domain, putative AbiEii toxin, Type IV TA system/AAA domain
MPHIHSLRLKQHKGHKESTLHDFGKINVLCGPNNSGKTTILECIASQKLQVLGKPLDTEAIIRLEQVSMQGKHWRSQTHEKAYPDYLANAASHKTIWFSDEADTYWTILASIWSKQFNGTPGDKLDVHRAFQAEFSPMPSVVLIPAKRRLQSATTVQSSEQIEPSGSGVLNYLFYAKNQDETDSPRQHFEKIAFGFSEITQGHEFDIVLREGNQIELRFRRLKSSWFNADDCGLGLRDLLIMLYFGIASDHDVVLIEEPENHLHPEIQRRLLKHIRNHSQKQFFISTHSSVFLNTQFVERVFTCRLTDGIKIENTTNRATMLTELGYSIADNLVSDLVVLCEGPTDKVVLEEFFRKMGLLGRFMIKVWPLGGDIMDQLDLSVFGEAYRVTALLDGDPGSSKIRKNFLTKCAEQNVPAHQLQRYALENYFTLSAIATVMGGQMPPSIKELNPKQRVSDQLGFEVKRNGLRIAKEMSLEDIKGTDLEAFLKQVESLAAQGKNK